MEDIEQCSLIKQRKQIKESLVGSPTAYKKINLMIFKGNSEMRATNRRKMKISTKTLITTTSTIKQSTFPTFEGTALTWMHLWRKSISHLIHIY